MEILSQLFWAFLIFSALQPLLRKRMLDGARARLMRVLERERGSRLIVMIHRQETMSLLGFPVLRYIDVHDAEEVIRAIHLTDREAPIDLVLHTPGGLVLASTRIARAIQAHRGKVTVFVPHMAMSGGTLIALAADEIVMDCHAVLGPVDPQIGEFPAASILRAVGRKDVNRVDDRTLILADLAEKALVQLEREVLDLLRDKMPPDEAAALAQKLSQGTWTHDHPISFDEAKQLGLPVSSELPSEVYRLMDLYPQPLRRQPSVEYLPHPSTTPPGDARG